MIFRVMSLACFVRWKSGMFREGKRLFTIVVKWMVARVTRVSDTLRAMATLICTNAVKGCCKWSARVASPSVNLLTTPSQLWLL